MVQKQFSGNAVGTTLASDITGTPTTFTTTANSGWPTTGPYVAVIDRGTALEEKVLVSARSGSIHTIQTRGYDSTTSQNHSSGATVEHCLDADTIQEANSHVNNTGLDNHTQYLNSTRHNAVSHLIGTHLPAPSAPVDITTATSAAGASTSAARADHVHGLAANSVTSAAIAAAVAGNGLTGGAGSPIAVVNADSSIVVAANDIKVGTLGALSYFASPTLPPYLNDATAPSSPATGQLWFRPTAGRLLRWNGTNWMIIAGGPFIRYTSSSVTSITSGVATDITDWARTVDSENSAGFTTWAGASAVTTFTVPAADGQGMKVDGIYNLHVAARFASVADTTVRALSAVVTGTEVGTKFVWQGTGVSGGGTVPMLGTIPLRLAAGDTVKITVQQNSGAGLALSPSQNTHHVSFQWAAPFI